MRVKPLTWIDRGRNGQIAYTPFGWIDASPARGTGPTYYLDRPGPFAGRAVYRSRWHAVRAAERWWRYIVGTLVVTANPDNQDKLSPLSVI